MVEIDRHMVHIVVVVHTVEVDHTVEVVHTLGQDLHKVDKHKVEVPIGVLVVRKHHRVCTSRL